MARKVLTKPFKFLSLCAGALVSIFGGVYLLKNVTVTAAELTQTEPVSLIVASSDATVDYEDGVKVSSEVAYGGQIDYTFTGDTTIKFNFAEPHEGWYAGNFVFRVTDAVDTTKYFDIEYKVVHTWASSTYTKIGHTNAYVKYGSEVRTSKQSGAAWYNKEVLNAAADTNGVICAPSMTINAAYPQAGILKLGYDANGHFSVRVNKQKTADLRAIAVFDGTKTFEDQVSWGLPEMPFENGYTISFSSEFEHASTTDRATDVCFKSIQNGGVTYDFKTNNNAEEITIAARENYDDLKVGDTVVIPNATYGNGETVENVKVISSNEETTTVSVGANYEIGKAGTHTVVYTTSAGSVAAFSFDVAEYFATTDFIHTNVNVSQNSSGLTVASEKAYNATFKGVFAGDTTIKFEFPELYEGWCGGNFVFRVTDALDASKYFDVEYRVLTTWGSVAEGIQKCDTGAYVNWNGNIRSAQYWGSLWYNSYKTNSETANYAPGFRSVYEQDGVLQFIYENGKLAVKANAKHATNLENMKTIAVFDGTETFEDQVSWGLPTMPFKNGYTISFRSEFEHASTTDKATDVCFKSIQNGGVTYDFTANAEIKKEAFGQRFEKAFVSLKDVEAPAGKVFLGWRSSVSNALYPSYSLLKKTEGETFEAVVVAFDTLKGASVRIDTSENGQSGIRFTTIFDTAEYEKISLYVKEMGTLVMNTKTLEESGKEFLVENFVKGETIAQVSNTKGTYEYLEKKTQTVYTAYSMAIVGIQDYAKKFSARAYMTIEYADGSQKTIYSDYNAEADSRSIAEVAYLLKTTDEAAYEAMNDVQKAIIDAYVAGYQE